MASIQLDELDHELETRRHQLLRNADDLVILRNCTRAVQRTLTSITGHLKKTLKLIVNESKSKMLLLQEASFLGFSHRPEENSPDSKKPKEAQS